LARRTPTQRPQRLASNPLLSKSSRSCRAGACRGSFIWAFVPWLNAGANLLDTGERSAVWEQRRTVVILNYAALSFAIIVALLGVERIAGRVATPDAATSRALLGASSRSSFREMNNRVVPLFATTATSVAFAVSALIHDGWKAGLLRGATWFVLGVAIWTFLWTYASLQLGLTHLGRTRLRDDASLLLVIGGALAAFVFSLWGLHRQIADVKENRLALARELYAQAYEPVGAERTLDALERQHSLLGAADALEKRTRAIHEWPVGEGSGPG
jgi:hypothetical protein